MQREESSSVLNDKEVDHNDDNPDDEEGWVVKEATADVDLVVDLPRSNHVNDLEPDEQVEDEGHMTARVSSGVFVFVAICPLTVLAFGVGVEVNDLFIKFITIDSIQSTREYKIAVFKVDHLTIFSVVTESFVGFRDHVLTTEQEDKENDHLEDGHPQDVLGHLARYDEVLFDLWWTVEEFRLGELGSQSQRGKRVHDHVDPEKLNSLQG